MMAPVTMLIGAALIGLGAWGYLGTEPEHRSVTALIPSFFGVALVLLGLLAFQEKLRKHVMHLAVLIGLVGLVVPAIRSARDVPTLLEQGKVIKEVKGTERDMTRAVQSQIAMAGICLVFVILCINSFIQARRARAQRT